MVSDTLLRVYSLLRTFENFRCLKKIIESVVNNIYFAVTFKRFVPLSLLFQVISIIGTNVVVTAFETLEEIIQDVEVPLVSQ